VNRGSGSSLKYSFSVPAMAFTSISLIITDTSLLSVTEREKERDQQPNWLTKYISVIARYIVISLFSCSPL